MTTKIIKEKEIDDETFDKLFRAEESRVAVPDTDSLVVDSVVGTESKESVVSLLPQQPDTLSQQGVQNGMRAPADSYAQSQSQNQEEKVYHNQLLDSSQADGAGTLAGTLESTLISIRDFDDDEKKELCMYIQNNTPHSVLEQTFILSEDPFEKSENLLACYRILNTCAQHASRDDTRQKLQQLLESIRIPYLKLYELLVQKRTAGSLGLYRIRNQIVLILQQYEYMKRINNCIDCFIILAEKYELLDLNKISGIDLETDEGKKLLKDVAQTFNAPKNE